LKKTVSVERIRDMPNEKIKINKMLTGRRNILWLIVVPVIIIIAKRGIRDSPKFIIAEKITERGRTAFGI